MKMENYPIIIVGMHRSGTTMLTRLLEKMGLFIGAKKRKNYEATFFQKINKWLLFQGNSSWDYPLNFEEVDEDFSANANRVISARLKSNATLEFLGKSKFLQKKNLFDLSFPWGWKDPVNSITIDFWMSLFPSAKIIYVYRNPVDVANSLKEREKKRREQRTLSFKQKIKEKFLVKEYQYNQSYRINQLENGFSLWKEYIKVNERALQKYPNQIMKVKYEDILSEPQKYIRDLAQFCGLNPSDSIIVEEAKKIDIARQYGFLNEPKLVDFYKSIQQDPVVVAMNYDKIV